MYKNYEEHMQALTELYSEEIAFLVGQGWEDVKPVGTYGGCTALKATYAGYSILATDGDYALVRDRDDEDSHGWVISLYDSEDQEIRVSESPSFEVAWAGL